MNQRPADDEDGKADSGSNDIRPAVRERTSASAAVWRLRVASLKPLLHVHQYSIPVRYCATVWGPVPYKKRRGRSTQEPVA